MAAPLKDSFGPEVPRRLAGMLAAVDPGFPSAEFVAEATDGLTDLELSDRSRLVAQALIRYLPDDPAKAIVLITRSLPDSGTAARWQGMDSFMLWPFTMVIAERGLDAFEESMAAQHAITKLFTAEFSIRTFIRDRHEPTMARLTHWATDPDEHVRRLVSEGTRPRLPWAARLEMFVADPAPIVPLLDRLVDDDSQYVRRSVANNVNDIAKDHPDVALAVCERWLGEDGGRRPLVRHALRTLVKAADPQALGLLGFPADPRVRVGEVSVTPKAVRIGEDVSVSVTVVNDGNDPARALVDLDVGFARQSGSMGRKVFRGAELDLPANGSTRVRRRVTLRQLSTRTVYPGTHHVTPVVNGRRGETVTFEVLA